MNRERGIRIGICGVGSYSTSPLETKLLCEIAGIGENHIQPTIGELKHLVNESNILEDIEPYVLQNEIPLFQSKPLNRRERRKLKFKKRR